MPRPSWQFSVASSSLQDFDSVELSFELPGPSWAEAAGLEADPAGPAVVATGTVVVAEDGRLAGQDTGLVGAAAAADSEYVAEEGVVEVVGAVVAKKAA